MTTRRSFIIGLSALVAAPAIVRVDSLMRLPAPVFIIRSNRLTIDLITRDAVRLFKQSNLFLRTITEQYDREFAMLGARVGDELRIRVPLQFAVNANG